MGTNNVRPNSVGNNIIIKGKKKVSKAPSQETKPEADQKQEPLAHPNPQQLQANFMVQKKVNTNLAKQTGKQTEAEEEHTKPTAQPEKQPVQGGQKKPRSSRILPGPTSRFIPVNKKTTDSDNASEPNASDILSKPVFIQESMEASQATPVQQPARTSEFKLDNVCNYVFKATTTKYEDKNKPFAEIVQNLSDFMQQKVDGKYHYLINDHNVVKVASILLLARCQDKDKVLEKNNFAEMILTECKKYINPENVAKLADILVWDISCREIPEGSDVTTMVADFLEAFKGNIDANNLSNVAQALSWAMFHRNIPKGQEGAAIITDFLEAFKGNIDAKNLDDVAKMIVRAILNKNIPEGQDGARNVTEFLAQCKGNIDAKNASSVEDLLKVIRSEEKDQEMIKNAKELLDELQDKEYIDKYEYKILQDDYK